MQKDEAARQWFAPKLVGKELELISKVLESGYLNDGQITKNFESALAEKIGVKYCVAVTSGTTAITAALLAAGVGPGDEVIVPALTFIATANAATLIGAKVKLVDVRRDNLTIDPELVEKAITPKTKAIVSVDVNGRLCDYGALELLAKKHGIHLICDAAEALGTYALTKKLYGDFACFSFSANKFITTGQGGIIATNSKEFNDRLRELKDQGRRFTGTGGDDLHPVMGFNFKFTNVQAAIGMAQLEALDARIQQALHRDEFYYSRLKLNLDVEIPKTESGLEVLQWTDLLVENRDELKGQMERGGFGTRAFWFPLHFQKPYHLDESLGVTEACSKRGLWLPSSFDINDSVMIQVCDLINKVETKGLVADVK